MELRFDSASEAETFALAAHLAQGLRAGDVIRLSGPLGAGKTRFVQGLAAALGAGAGNVVSPTFTLIHEYDGRLPVVHVDAYRLRDGDEFRELGGEELLAGGNVLCIEWADRITEVLPPDGLSVSIEPIGPTDRRLAFVALGERGRELLAGLEGSVPEPAGQVFQPVRAI